MIEIADKQIPKILILGGGYGGLECALKLQKSLPLGKAEIVMVNKHDYHYQTTLLHKVAIGTLSERKARIFYRKILNPHHITFIKDKVLTIDPEKKQVKCCRHCLSYDYLVVGLGFKPETFGVVGVEEHAYKLSSLNAALELAKDIEDKFKDYEITLDKNNLKFIICGTGLTSIEFAAELATQFKDLCTICGIDRSLPQVTCIGRSSHILPMFSEKTIKRAMEKLDALGVNVINDAEIIACDEKGVLVRHKQSGFEEHISANSVIWGAGVSGSQIVQQSVFPNKNGRVLLDEYLRVPGYSDVFMVGDCGVASGPSGSIPPSAQLSSQMGAYVAGYLKNIVMGNANNKGFKFINRGTVCSLGHTDGVAQVYNHSLKGEVAAFIKNTIENRWLFNIGGIKMVFKKGQLRHRTSN